MSRELTDLRAGVVGTGFIGAVHNDALRRLGVQVAGVVGSTPDRAAAKALEVSPALIHKLRSQTPVDFRPQHGPETQDFDRP